MPPLVPTPHRAVNRPRCDLFPQLRLQSIPFPFNEFRRTAFGHRRPCPRCGGIRVYGWGGFRGRRRFRCVACGRTFSDFTGTPLQHLKRLDRWLPFCAVFGMGLTVRRTASLLGIDPTTSFRWRHRLLGPVVASEHYPLSGFVDWGDAWFTFSEKGSRRLDRPARRRAPPFWSGGEPRTYVLLANDSQGRAVGRHVGARRPGRTTVLELVIPRVAPGTTLLTECGPFGDGARIARLTGLPWRWRRKLDRATAPSLEPLRVYTSRLKRWMRPFHGVATRYLDHYLGWFRLVDGPLVEAGDPVPAALILSSGRFP